MVYKWRQGGSHTVDATATGQYFEGLEARDGAIRAETVLDEARAEDALLHPVFEWDDGVAAEQYRLSQSRKLIGDLVRVTVCDSGEQQETRAFVNVVAHPITAEYRSVTVAMSDDSMRGTVLANAYKELTAFKKKYSELSELGEVFKAIDKLIA